MFDFLPNPFPWSTVASTSLSVILSFFGFVIGVRAGKNNRDRGYLRDIYKNIFAYLRELKESIETGRPKQWANYPLIGNKYTPLIRSLEQDGSINALPDKLADDLSAIEQSTLNNNLHWEEIIEKSISERIRTIFLDSVEGNSKSISGASYRLIRLSKMMILEDMEFEQFLNGLDEQEVGMGLELKVSGSRTDMLYAYSETLKSGSLSALAQKIRRECKLTNKAKEIIKINRQNIEELDNLMDRIAKRIKDPHPFWSSVGQVFRDPFR